jgi:hypothetical protein
VAGVVEPDGLDAFALGDDAFVVFAFAGFLPAALGAFVDRARAEGMVGGLAEEEVAAGAPGRFEVLDRSSSRSLTTTVLRRPLSVLGSISPSYASQPASTPIRLRCSSSLSVRSARSSPHRSPAYIAVAHSAWSRSSSAAISRCASSAVAIRSRVSGTAGRRRPLVRRSPPRPGRRRAARRTTSSGRSSRTSRGTSPTPGRSINLPAAGVSLRSPSGLAPRNASGTRILRLNLR